MKLSLELVAESLNPFGAKINLIREHIMQDFTIDVGIFAGHVGCKHAWAAGRMVTDIVEKKYGVPVLTYDLDAGDIRYKSEQEVKDTIYDFFDTLAARGYEPGLERMKNLK